MLKAVTFGLLAVMACRTNSMLPAAQAAPQPQHWTLLIKNDLSQYDPKILRSRGGCAFGQTMGMNGSCEPRAGHRQERHQQRRCAHRVNGVCMDKHDRDDGDMDE